MVQNKERTKTTFKFKQCLGRRTHNIKVGPTVGISSKVFNVLKYCFYKIDSY